MKIAVITGASRGIGQALALRLAEDGITVYAVARNKTALAELSFQYPNIHTIEADLSTEAGINLVISRLEGKVVDFLINNAASLVTNELKNMKSSELMRTHMLNVIAPIKLCTELTFADDARIINVSSCAAEAVLFGLGAYSMSKAALNVATQSLKQEVFSHTKQLICSVYPGEIDTEMQRILRDYLPLSTLFQRQYENSQLIDATLCAQWLAWLLQKAKSTVFLACKTIYDETHFSEWLMPNQKISIPMRID